MRQRCHLFSSVKFILHRKTPIFETQGQKILLRWKGGKEGTKAVGSNFNEFCDMQSTPKSTILILEIPDFCPWNKHICIENLKNSSLNLAGHKSLHSQATALCSGFVNTGTESQISPGHKSARIPKQPSLALNLFQT